MIGISPTQWYNKWLRLTKPLYDGIPFQRKTQSEVIVLNFIFIGEHAQSLSNRKLSQSCNSMAIKWLLNLLYTLTGYEYFGNS